VEGCKSVPTLQLTNKNNRQERKKKRNLGKEAFWEEGDKRPSTEEKDDGATLEKKLLFGLEWKKIKKKLSSRKRSRLQLSIVSGVGRRVTRSG